MTIKKPAPDPWLKMIEEFQCPGCVCGDKPGNCARFEPEAGPGDLSAAWRCKSHVLGTTFYPGGVTIALGLPKGFNRGGLTRDGHSSTGFRYANYLDIRLWPEDAVEKFFAYLDQFQIPVWAMEEDGNLFVRVVQPRIGSVQTHVVAGGKISALKERWPSIVDVGEFYEEID